MFYFFKSLKESLLFYLHHFDSFFFFSQQIFLYLLSVATILYQFLQVLFTAIKYSSIILSYFKKNAIHKVRSVYVKIYFYLFEVKLA